MDQAMTSTAHSPTSQWASVNRLPFLFVPSLLTFELFPPTWKPLLADLFDVGVGGDEDDVVLDFSQWDCSSCKTHQPSLRLSMTTMNTTRFKSIRWKFYSKTVDWF